ncbi:hypothetical protein K523DRAFT_403220 [Schizophyllum commune Tattone D]|nr:hypothetical protein K523DRAFT_403220 [Schizophyllum commune Tattone D]
MGCHPSRTSTIDCLEDGGFPADRIESCSLPHDLPTVHQPVRTPTDPAIEDDAKPPSINNQYVEDEEPLIHHLPIELLSEIFRLCGDPSTVTDILSLGPVLFPALTPTLDFGRHTFLASAFALQQVCRRWHDLARALPELWTQLDFGHRLPADPVRVAEVCIERAGALPLTLRLRQTDSCSQAACGALLGVVAEDPGRWRQLVVEVRDGDAVLRPVLACADASMTELQVAVIRTVLPWGQAQGSCKIDVLAMFHSHFPGLRLMHNSIHLYLYLAYGSMLYTQSSSSLKAFEFVLAHYTVPIPANCAVSRLTIEFATARSGNARASHGRAYSDLDSGTQNVSTAPRAAPTNIEATPVIIEHSHRLSRLRALRNYLVHRLVRGSSRHTVAETHAATNEHATNESNSREHTPEVRSNNESTSTSHSSSAFTTELIVEASDAGRHTEHERAIGQMREHLARLSARLDEVERRASDMPPLSSSTNSSPSEPPNNGCGLLEASAAGGRNGIYFAPRTPSGLAGPRNVAPWTLASDAHDVPFVTPRPACAPPPHAPPGLQSYRRRLRMRAGNGRNGPPVTPTSLNFSGQFIADSPPSMLETWDGTLPDGVSNGIPISSLQAPGGTTPTALGPYPSQPLRGLQDGANATSSQPHDDLDCLMPPTPAQLMVLLPDAEEEDDDVAAPPPLSRVPVPLPDIGEPEIKLSPPRIPDPVLEGHDFGCDDSNALDLHLTHSEPPILLPRLEKHHRIPNPIMVYDDSETDLARERARARLLQLLHDPTRSFSISGAGQTIFGATGTMSDDIFIPTDQAGSMQASPARHAHNNRAAPGSSGVLPATTTTRVKTGADINVPRVDGVADAPIIPETSPTEMRDLLGLEELPTFVGSMDASRPCAGMRLLISVGDKSVPKGCSSHFSGDFEDAMAGLSGFCDRPTVKHRLTQLYVRIHQPLDHHRQDVMMRIMRTLDKVLGCFHVVELYMATESHMPLEEDFRLLVEGEVSGRRLLCFPLHLINELDIRIPIDANDILQLIERTRSLHLLDLHFRPNDLGSIFDPVDVKSASLHPIYRAGRWSLRCMIVQQ